MIWKSLQGSKIRITLLIEYLKVRTLFEIRITLQTKLILSSLNDSTCNLNYIELQKKLSHWLKKAQILFLLYFTSLLTNTTYNLYDFI